MAETTLSRARGLLVLCAITTGLLAALLPARSQAEPSSSDWQWGATVYVWLPSMGGDTSFPPSGDGPAIDVTADAILDSLNFAFMGAFEGRKGPWGVATDIIYLDLGASKKGTRDLSLEHVDLPASVDANLRLDITGWLWTLAGSYSVVGQDGFSMDVLAGARMLDLQEDLKWSFNGDISSLPLPGRSGSSHAKDTQWDAIVGLKGRANFGAEGSWYVPYYVDVGTGDSDLTWQGMIGLGYRFDSVDVTGVWRYLDYDMGNSAPIRSINFNGPAVGVTFRFH
jgi:hypothetical protein